ncbi:MAG: outer membrane protein transport protein [Sutterella wadsworthensis]|nr:outer membrane protein transport protein [Sutterella wadsworthensis]
MLQNFIRSAAATAVFAAFASAANAGGFQLTEQSALALGRAYAGVGVDGSDVSGVYYNPATMTLHPGTQMQLGIVGVGLNLDYAGDNGSRENGRKKPEVVPHAFVSHQLTDDAWVGFALTVPFGLSTDYSNNWDQAGEGTSAMIKVIDFNPNFAYKLSDKVSLGAGFSYQYVEAKLGFNWDKKLLAGMSHLKVDGHAWGWNVGMMWTPVDTVRIGVSYRSKVEHTVYGTLKTQSNIMGRFPTSMDASVTMDAPAWAMLSAAWEVNDWLNLYGTFRWADWSSFQSLTIETSTLPMPLESKKNWKDTYLMTLGYDAKMSDFWTLRGGVGYETSTISDPTLRTGTIPDADRYWLAIGSSFHWTKDFQTDVAFAHLRGVHERSVYQGGQEIGKFRKLDAYLIGVQAQYRF